MRQIKIKFNKGTEKFMYLGKIIDVCMYNVDGEDICRIYKYIDDRHSHVLQFKAANIDYIIDMDNKEKIYG